MRSFHKVMLAVAATLGIGAAQAATVYSHDYSGDAPLASPGSITATFSAAAGAGSTTFQLNGFTSLDGDNYYIDVFHLTLNGSEVFSGTWDMGGGGTNRILLNPNGGSASSSTYGWFAGGQTDITVPLTLAAGTNTLVFSYDSPTVFELTGRAGPQGLGDEGWGLGKVGVVGSVPEPETYALMLGGLALLAAVRRQRPLRG